MKLGDRSFKEVLQSRYRRGIRFLFSALAFMGSICTSIAAGKVTVPIFGDNEPLNPGARAEFVDISGTFTQDPNVEFSTLSVSGGGNCFFGSLLVALEVHKALESGNGSVEIEKTISHDSVIGAREQFKVLGRALVDWYQVNVKGSKYVRLTPDGKRAIERFFQAKEIADNKKEQKSTVESLVRRLCCAYNKLSLDERKAAYREHYRQVCEILAPNDNCTEFFTELYPWERWSIIELDTIQWYHVNAIFADRMYFPTDLVDLCAGLKMCAGVEVLLVELKEGNWMLHSTETNLNKPAVYIQIVNHNHYEPLVKVLSDAETSGHYVNCDHDWTSQARQIDGAREGIDLAVATADSERVHQRKIIASQKND